MAFRDWITKARSDEELGRLAHACRLESASGHEWAPDVLGLIERLVRSGRLAGLRIVVRPDTEMPEDEARAFVDERIIEVRQSVHDGGRRGAGRDRLTILHEVGHIVLDHRGEPKSRKPGVGAREEGIAPSRSVERQATVFAAAFLMPMAQVRKCADVAELAAKLKVSMTAARIRFENVNLRQNAKPVPPDIRAAIERLKISVGVQSKRPTPPSVLSIEQQIALAWDTASELSGHDPREYRSVDDRYVIRRSRWSREAPGGWRLSGGKIIPWESEND